MQLQHLSIILQEIRRLDVNTSSVNRNADYYLSFDVQSYYKSKADRLKVLVLEDDAVYSNFTTELYEKFKANGKVLYDEQLSPGESEEI